MGKLLFYHFRVTNSKLKSKNFTSSYWFEKWKNKILISKSLEISLLKWNSIQFRIIWKNVGILDFVTLDIDLVLKRYCLWSWYYSAHTLRYAIVFFEKAFVISFFIVIKYAVFIRILGFQKLMQVDGYKYLQDYRRLFSSCKPNEKLTYITRYN